MKRIKKGWDEFWSKIIAIDTYGDEKHAFCVAELQVKHAIKVLGLKKGARILDIGCGAGFHCITFSKMGFKTVGIDISSTLIKFASDLAKKHKVKCKFYKMSMESIKFRGEFDAVMFFNQTFPTFDDEKNLEVLRKVNYALKNKGKVYIQNLNPFVYAIKFEKYYEWNERKNGFRLIKVNFDFLTQTVKGENYFITKNGEIFTEKDGDVKSINFRMFTPMQWAHLLTTAGFKNCEFYGSQELPPKKFTVSSKELIVVAGK